MILLSMVELVLFDMRCVASMIAMEWQWNLKG